MGCKIGPLVPYEGWTCSKEFSDISEHTKHQFIHIQRSIEQTLGLLSISITKEDKICTDCMKTFARQRYNSCKHPNHKGAAARTTDRHLHFVTAMEYHCNYNCVLPNDAICDICRKAIDEPPLRKILLDDLNTLQTLSTPTAAPLSFHKRNLHGQATLIKEIVKTFQKNIGQRCEAAGLPVLETETLCTSPSNKDSEDLNWIMQNLKSRTEGATNAEKKSFLTIVHPSWSINKTTGFFGVSRRLVKASRKLFRETSTILPPVVPKNGRKLPEDSKTLVQNFYYEEEVSRACPGMRDVLSIKNIKTGKRLQKQKRYLLNNLAELYQLFKIRNPDTKLGISTFLILRPKECLSLNTKGFHNVCVCIYHQNVKLLFNAIGETSIKPWIQHLICPEPRKECYYRRCQECQDFKVIMKTKLFEQNKKIQEHPVIQFRRWTSTDGTNFVTDEKPALDFLDFISTELESLLKHHFVTQNQQQYLRDLKTTMEEQEIIVWGDFAENYSPVIQDAIQSEYFNHKQITIHPFTIYWRSAGITYNAGFCVISDCTMHDTNSFYALQSRLLPCLFAQFKTCGMNINHINYFSDGCAAQYKNRKNFANLSCHQEDFGVTASWNFLSTAHGKGPCDALGGTTKRLARTASLTGAKITTAFELYSWCVKNIHNVEYLFVPDTEVQEIVEKSNLTERYQTLSTVAGTKQAHLIKIEDGKIKLFETSVDEQPFAVREVHSSLPPIILEE